MKLTKEELEEKIIYMLFLDTSSNGLDAELAKSKIQTAQNLLEDSV